MRPWAWLPFVVMGTLIGLVIWGSVAGPTVDATDIVTVVEYVDETCRHS